MIVSDSNSNICSYVNFLEHATIYLNFDLLVDVEYFLKHRNCLELYLHQKLLESSYICCL